MINRANSAAPALGRWLATLVLLTAIACSSQGAAALAAGIVQQQFASPAEAAAALADAAGSNSAAKLLAVLGPEGRQLVFSGDKVADQRGRQQFAKAYGEANHIVQQSPESATLQIGTEDWPFPIPLVHGADGWRFDTVAGAREIIDRRIGRNELAAIEVCRAYVDAQRDYASHGLAGSGILEYAQHLMSGKGKHDGLYWPVAEGAPESPMGPLFAQARAAGYSGTGAQNSHEPYHGYYYRILTRQGTSAAGGAYDYLANGHMIGGFALVAFPARYADSGVMTFIVNQDGEVYQKDLGRNTAAIARRMARANP